MSLISSATRQGFIDAGNGSRLAELAIGTRRIRSKDGGTSDTPVFSATDDMIDLYLNANPVGTAFITAKLTGVPGGEDGSTWRHYMIWRDKDTFLAMPYLATFPIMGGKCYLYNGTDFTLRAVNMIEAVGYSGESVQLYNRSYSRLKFKITKAKPAGGTDTIVTDWVNPSETVDVDPVDGDDLRAITEVEIDSVAPASPPVTVPLQFRYTFFIKPSLQNTALKVPF